MTTFESIMCLAATAAVIVLAFGVLAIKDMLKEIIYRQYANWEQLRKIETHTNFLCNISHKLDNIEVIILDILKNIHSTDKYLDDLSINVKGNYNTLEQQQEDIGYIKMRILGLTHPIHEVVDQPPCYAPNGICTNPQMDCIGCPKRGTGGTWSTNTSIKAEDAPLQEWFNDNKED